ncbi:hypothetical protein GCM10028818_42500 [Spirosoma horti]
MNRNVVRFAILLGLLTGRVVAQKRLSADPRLQWWQDSRLSLFVHWGPVSRIGQEISWSRQEYGPARYDSLYRQFNPTRFNAREWVRLAKANGFRQIVLTAKHHDGFCLWDTKTTTYNSRSAPFGRDVCKELAEAAHQEGLPIGWYFSVGDWKDPDCRNPATNEQFVRRMLTQVRELLTNYGKISLLWIDYDGWTSPVHPRKVYELARRLQPAMLINNRLEPFSPDESHARVGPYSDYATPEGFVAGYGTVPWETCTNMGHQWAWKFGDSPRPLPECMQTLLRCIGGNGNLLFNMGPDSTGVFPTSFVERTNEMGTWIRKHAPAIYKTRGGPYTPAKDYVSVYRGNTVYLYLFPEAPTEIRLPKLPATIKSARLLDGTPVSVQQQANEVRVSVPNTGRDAVATVVELTLDRPAASLGPIRPFSSSHALSYGRNARASSAVGKFLHDPSAAVDDNPNTVWKMGRRTDVNLDPFYGRKAHFLSDSVIHLFQHAGWLEVDLGKPQTIDRLMVSEQASSTSAIKSFKIQYQKKGQWVTVAQDIKMGDWSKTIDPVRAQKIRLLIEESSGYPGIREFQVFGGTQ